MTLTLTPFVATTIFVAVCLSGHNYRSVWKAEGPRWKLWAFGLVAAVGLGVLAFIPMQASV